MKSLIAFCCSILAWSNALAIEIPLINPDFEAPVSGKTIPGWTQSQHAGSAAYEMEIDTKTFCSGKSSFRMKRTQPQVYGLTEQTVPITGADEKKVELTAALKSAAVGSEGWILAISFYSNYGLISETRAPLMKGTVKKWKNVKINTDIPKGTSSIKIGAMLLDEGTGWIDDVHLRILDQANKSPTKK